MGNRAGRGQAVKVAVLMGGWSAEREVSLTSGRGIAAACRALGHDVTEIDMDRDVAAALTAAAPDVVFNALHGTPGEDGSIQGLMDILGLRYTHSGVTTSAIAIDKELTKRILVPQGVRMPEGVMVASEALFVQDPLPRPYVLKPVNEGSSVGVAIVTDASNYGNPIGRAVAGPWQAFATLLAEPFIAGKELTVAILGDEALAVTELIPTTGFYDYDAKYTDGLTRHQCPADLPAQITAACLDMALAAHRALGCKGTSRSDFRWDPDQGEAGLYLLEVNTQPGMTPLSLVPEQAKYRGISYEMLVQRLIDAALE
ncbi:D-alanine--D-alanine ligase [Polymorphobacter fuscus]|uniref:D-alanine--D-alanine ligase n=1 Tax=Sandarakinorhabdus fusca TaxID=1439888 RepID=A0A7C9KPB4_9SPHN|nr:D-alanine--D-alanine ligase [Polymorphobacter fuscus]KAB7644458.1 D-alanine--D-alanine ligase [Polymorphobacter fuscus]MQT18384.1 D-alanine--D-alanine ligase [Polymorphobacter fuscus]